MIAAEFRFLSVEDVLELHEMQLESYGGATEIRASDLIESAVMMPQASFGGQFVHADVFTMAAAYAFHIAENQPFVDGNKRTALAAALVFLDWQHFEIEDTDDELYDAMIGLAIKKIDKNGLANLFRKLAKPNQE